VIFFDGINDSEREVGHIVKFARRVPSKVNVIPFHRIDFAHPGDRGTALRPSPRAAEIVNTLREEHLTVMVRSSAGDDIQAACGQLVIAGDGGGGRAAASGRT